LHPHLARGVSGWKIFFSSGGFADKYFQTMKKLKKILLISSGIPVVLVIAAVVVVALSLDKIVKKSIETIAPQITQTPVTLDSVSISVFTGSVGVKGFVIGNPDGYKTPQAISVGKAVVSVVPSSVLAGKIIVHSIEVRSPEITFEGNPLGANNLSKLMDNVNAIAGGSQPVTNAPAKSGASKPVKKLQVDDFLITGAKVHVSLTGLVNREMTLPLPEIHLTGLGAGSDGITPAQLTKEVLGQITKETLIVVVEAVRNLGKGVENLGKDLGKEAGETAGESVNKVTKGLGGLLGK
jgi:hypothetical protein